MVCGRTARRQIHGEFRAQPRSVGGGANPQKSGDENTGLHGGKHQNAVLAAMH
jgi:hypothetical protein